eukprot:Sspe_Gene.15803::Locus_5512_Transcript_1_1_Confidence_1.000_Length_6457::g.15803::m.15803
MPQGAEAGMRVGHCKVCVVLSVLLVLPADATLPFPRVGAGGLDAIPGYGRLNQPVRSELSRGVYAAGEQVRLTFNGTLAPQSFVEGQEVRVRVAVAIEDLSLRFENVSYFEGVAQENTTMVCLNGTVDFSDSELPDREHILETRLARTVGVPLVYLSVANASVNSSLWTWGACYVPKCCNVTVNGDYHELPLTKHTALSPEAVVNQLYFNQSSQSGVELVVWPHVPGASCADMPTSNVTSYYYWTQDLGGSRYDEAQSLEVYATFDAPPFAFFICVRRSMIDERLGINTTSKHAWLTFSTEWSQTVFQANTSSGLFYLPPRVVTTGMYLAVKLFSYEEWPLTVAPSPFAGDNAKFVLRGHPCTYESTQHDYYGSQYVAYDGTWSYTASEGLVEGSTAGGGGVAGHDNANPLLGDITGVGSGREFVSFNGTSRYTVLYLRAPDVAGEYDLCVSLRSMRRELAQFRDGNMSIPVWRKVTQCPSSNITGNPWCHMTRDEWRATLHPEAEHTVEDTPFAVGPKSLTVEKEQWGWTAVDLTPETWGWLRFDTGDDVESTLKPSRAWHTALAGTKDYTMTIGGDTFRLVAEKHFASEKRMSGRAAGILSTSVVQAGGKAFDQRTDIEMSTSVGSLCGVGCWSPTDDSFAETGSAAPTASYHLAPDIYARSPWWEGDGDYLILRGSVGGTVPLAVSISTASRKIQFEFSCSQLTYWFGFIFGATAGSGTGYAMIALGTGVIKEYRVEGWNNAGELTPMLDVLSDYIDASTQTRKVRVVRNLKGLTASHADFSGAYQINVLAGEGDTTDFLFWSSHRSVATVSLMATDFAANTTRETFGAIRVPEAERWRVCYRQEGYSGWRVLPFRHADDPVLPPKWRHLQRTVYPHTKALVPGYYYTAPLGRHSFNATWTMNSTTARTWGPLLVTATTALDTLANNYDRVYFGSDAIANSVGFAVRVVPSSAPCEGLLAANILGRPHLWAESSDAGKMECTAGELLQNSTARDCRGSMHSSATATSEIAFYIHLPSPGEYRVCIRYGGFNWIEAQPSPDVASQYLTTGPPPKLSVVSFDALTPGNEVMVVVRDAEKGIAIRDDPDGDWMRLVESSRTCDPVGGLLTANPPFAPFHPNLSDTYLQRYCPGVFGVYDLPCRSDPVASAVFCHGNCSSPVAHRLRSFLPPETRTVPHGGLPVDNAEYAAATFRIPESASNVPHKLCYRKAGGNWVVLPLDTGPFPPSPPRLHVVSPALPLRGGSLVPFEVVDSGAVPVVGPDSLVSLKLVPLAPPLGFVRPRGREPPPMDKGITHSAGSVWALGGRVFVSVELQQRTAKASVTLSGPSDVWFGVGFGCKVMLNCYAVIVDPPAVGGVVRERFLGEHTWGTQLADSLTKVSSTVANGMHTVVLERPLSGTTASHYTFATSLSAINAIVAVGDPEAGPTLAYHGKGNRAALQLDMHEVKEALILTGVVSAVGGQVTGNLTVDRSSQRVRVEIEGPTDKWFAVGFGSQAMKDTYAIVVYPQTFGTDTVLHERQLGQHMAGALLTPSAVVTSDSSVNGRRRVVLLRGVAGNTTAHHSFVNDTVPYIAAVGHSMVFQYHGEGGKGAGVVKLQAHVTVTPGEVFPLTPVVGCADPPGSTEATPFASTSSHAQLTEGRAKFMLVVPQAAGRYGLCFAVNGTGGWRRLREYDVEDTEARWMVKGTANLPANQGVLRVSLLRCAMSGVTCDPLASKLSFNITPGGDALKIIPSTHNTSGTPTASACHDSKDGFAVAEYGTSYHVGIDEPKSLQGVTDLGPDDLTAKEAQGVVTLPAVVGDARTIYKVCVWVKAWGLWAEVPEMPRSGDYTPLGPFHLETSPAAAGTFAFHTLLAPGGEGKATDLPQPHPPLLVGGALTSVLPDLASPSPVGGWWVEHPIDTASRTSLLSVLRQSSVLKLVPRRRHSEGGWTMTQASCFDSGNVQETASTITAERGYFTLQVPLDGALPSLKVEYIVCLSLRPEVAWRQLLHSSGAESVVVVPSKLTFVASPSFVAFDSNSVSGGLLSSWCKAGSLYGVSCQGNAVGYQEDLLYVAPRGERCPVPTPTSGWLPLAPTGNFTTSLKPPETLSPPGGFLKMCVFKGGEPSAGAHTRKGVVYQMWN